MSPRSLAWTLHLRVVATAASFALFSGLYLALSAVGGRVASSLVALPVIAAAWLFGLRGGVAAGVFAAFLLAGLSAARSALADAPLTPVQALVIGGVLAVLLGGVVGYLHDTRARALLAEARLARLAHYDFLTDLANRALFERLLHQAIARAERRRQRLALVYVDLDNFKRVNDSFGHLLGDRVLRTVAGRIKQSVRASDLAARVGGDEFAIVLEAVSENSDAEMVSARIASAIGQPMVLDGDVLRVSGSDGFALYPDHATEWQALLQRADEAMYSMKGRLRDRETVEQFSSVQAGRSRSPNAGVGG